MGTVNSAPNNSLATAYGNQRKIDRCQNGVLWALTRVNDIQLVPAYSTDNGATWTSTTAIIAPGSGTTSYLSASLFIDVDDYAHVAYKDSQSGYIMYQRGTPNAARTAYTWSGGNVIDNNTVFDYPDVVAFRDPATAGAWIAHVVYTPNANASIKAYGARINIAANGTISANAAVQIAAAVGTTNANPGYASIDFRHTGDGKTVASGSPDLYVAWSAGNTGAGYGIRFRKATYASGSWTWGTEREIDNTRYHSGGGTAWLLSQYDGTRCIITGLLTNGTNSVTNIYDRDPSDPSTGGTTTRTVSSTTTENFFGASTTYDTAGNIYFVGRSGAATGNGTSTIGTRRWVRSTQTFDTFAVFDTTGPDAPYVSARRGPQGGAIDYVYTDGTASPYTVTSGRITLNQAPTAPTGITPADGSTYDSSADRTITFVHNDPDGDAASSYRLRFRPAGITTTYAYLTGTTTAANGATVTVTIPAGTWAGQVTFAPQTYDASGTEGAWGANTTITGIPTALANATGGQGGTAAPALSLYSQFRAEQAARTSGRSALATVASVSPLQITVDGSTVNASRNSGYTPVLNDLVDVGLINDTWVIRDRVV